MSREVSHVCYFHKAHVLSTILRTFSNLRNFPLFLNPRNVRESVIIP